MIFEFNKFTTADVIQLAMFFVAIIAIAFTGYQTLQQNRLYKAQLLKDRFEMYWKNYEGIAPELIAQMDLYPEDFMSRDLYESEYRHNERAQQRYIFQSRTYEYLAFLHILSHQLRIKDSISNEWSDKWLQELTKHSKEFRDAHAMYGDYYPLFRDHVNKILQTVDLV